MGFRGRVILLSLCAALTGVIGGTGAAAPVPERALIVPGLSMAGATVGKRVGEVELAYCRPPGRIGVTSSRMRECPSREFTSQMRPFRAGGGIRHCRDLSFSERLRVHGTGCSEARVIARRAARHVTSDTESGWRIDARVPDRRGRAWNCAGAGFNPLPLACHREGLWIKLQVWAD